MATPVKKSSLHLYLRECYGSSTQKLVRKHKRSLHRRVHCCNHHIFNMRGQDWVILMSLRIKPLVKTREGYRLNHRTGKQGVSVSSHTWDPEVSTNSPPRFAPFNPNCSPKSFRWSRLPFLDTLIQRMMAVWTSLPTGNRHARTGTWTSAPTTHPRSRGLVRFLFSRTRIVTTEQNTTSAVSWGTGMLGCSSTFISHLFQPPPRQVEETYEVPPLEKEPRPPLVMLPPPQDSVRMSDRPNEELPDDGETG